MGLVTVDKTMSLDGFIARKDDDVTRLFEWYGGTPTKDIVEALQSTGAVVMGRRSFRLIDNPEGWVTPDGTHLPWPVFVLTHEPRSRVKNGATVCTFVTDGIESAVAQAKATAGDKNIGVMGAQIAQECLKLGLLDEIRIHLVPVLLGEGIRLFDHLGSVPIDLELMRVDQAPQVTHLTYRVPKAIKGSK